MNKLGVYFRPEKREALLRGDISNAVVNRHFVYGFQVTGMYLSKAPDDSPATVRLLVEHIENAWVSFFETHGILKVQGVVLLVHAFVIMGLQNMARSLLPKAFEIIGKADIRFFPAYGRPPELSEQAREDAAVLSQAIYLENYLYLTSGGPEPVMATRIEREFRLDLQVRTIQFHCSTRSRLIGLVQRAYPLLFDICPLTMRTQGILLVRDATMVLNSNPADCETGLNVLFWVATDSDYLSGSREDSSVGYRPG